MQNNNVRSMPVPRDVKQLKLRIEKPKVMRYRGEIIGGQMEMGEDG
jgi:hypothetical protein